MVYLNRKYKGSKNLKFKKIQGLGIISLMLTNQLIHFSRTYDLNTELEDK